MDDNEHDPDNDILEEMLEQHENHHHVAQSEYNFPISSSSIHVHNTDQLQNRLQGLHVSDHPRQQTSPKPTVRVRRNSAGDETMLYCDFGDFNTQELISSPIEFEQNKDFLAYSTHSESASNQSLLPRPIPFSPTSSSTSVLYQNMTFATNAAACGPPQLPPKSNIPPPYRPPPNTTPFFGGPRAFDDDPFHKGHSHLAMSSSDGGSHDSHNDSGYCAVRGSGGPSPSLSGKNKTSMLEFIELH